MKKILCIMQLPPPLHGASQSNSNLSKSQLINSSYSLEIINLQFAASVAELKSFSFTKIWKALKYGLTIWKKVQTFKPDLVYFTLSPDGFAFYRDALYTAIVKILGYKVLFHLHGKGIKKASENSPFKKSIYQLVFKNTEVICLTTSLFSDIEDVYFTKPFIVPYGIYVDHESFNANPKGNNRKVQILYLGNYKESKGVLILINALDILKKKGLDFHARIVGDAGDLSVDDLMKYVENRSLQDCVEITGPRYGTEKYLEYKAADIFAFPTFYSNEAFPLVNLEAMQFGLPVISTNEGGIAAAIVDNETGFVIEPKNLDQLTDKLATLIVNKELRHRMGSKAKEVFFDQYTLQHFEHNLKNVFEIVLNK